MLVESLRQRLRPHARAHCRCPPSPERDDLENALVCSSAEPRIICGHALSRVKRCEEDVIVRSQYFEFSCAAQSCIAPARQDGWRCFSIDVPCNGADEGVFHLLRRDALPSAQVLVWLVGDVGNGDGQVYRVRRWLFEVVGDQPVDAGLAQWYARCWAEKQVLGKKLTPALYFRVSLFIAFSYADAEKLCWKPESAVSSISRGATCSMPVKSGEDRIVCRSADSVNKAAVFALFLESSESRPRRGRGVTAAATRAPAATGAPLVAMFDDSAFAAGGAASAFEFFFGGIVAAASAVRASARGWARKRAS